MKLETSSKIETCNMGFQIQTYNDAFDLRNCVALFHLDVEFLALQRLDGELHRSQVPIFVMFSRFGVLWIVDGM
jgi:hypothetical protein